MAITVALGGMCLQVGGDLGLQRREEHPSCPLAGDLVEHGAATDLVILRLPPSHRQHGCCLPAAAHAGAAVAQAGRYAAGVTGSTIHNFRSYLLREMPRVLWHCARTVRVDPARAGAPGRLLPQPRRALEAARRLELLEQPGGLATGIRSSSAISAASVSRSSGNQSRIASTASCAGVRAGIAG